MKGKDKKKKKDRKEKRRDTSYSKSVRAKLFCCAFKIGFLGFLQLMCKTSLIKSNKIQLSLLFQKKERATRVNACGCGCLKL